MPTCETCRFWEIIGSEKIKAGHCTCMPPQVVSADGKTLWPITRAESGCGEHRAKPESGANVRLSQFYQDRVAFLHVLERWIDSGAHQCGLDARDMQRWFRDCVDKAEAHYRGEALQ